MYIYIYIYIIYIYKQFVLYMLHLLDLKRNSPLPHTFLKFIAYQNLEDTQVS